MRAVVDTNVWVSALLTNHGPPAQVRAALGAGKFTLVTSEPLLAEFTEVLSRPRLLRKYALAHTDVDELVDLLRTRAEIVAVQGDLRLCRDPDDDVVIETAIVGRAQALVTRDDDLKGAAELTRALAERGVAVLTVRRFLARVSMVPAKSADCPLRAVQWLV